MWQCRRAVTLRTCEFALSYIAALLLATGCEKSDCVKIWDSQQALRKFGCEQRTGGKCLTMEDDRKKNRFMSQCNRWPADFRHCVAEDNPDDSNCRAIIERCLADPACEKLVNEY